MKINNISNETCLVPKEQKEMYKKINSRSNEKLFFFNVAIKCKLKQTSQTGLNHFNNKTYTQ